jgi:hypothetical protein
LLVKKSSFAKQKSFENPLQTYFQNLQLEKKEEIKIRRPKRKKQTSSKKISITDNILNRFIKKTKAGESRAKFELVDDSMKETLSKSKKSSHSKPLTLRETLSRRKQEDKQSSQESNLIKNLKDNIMFKSSLYGTKDNDTLSDLYDYSQKSQKNNINNNSVFRFNKFEIENKSSLYLKHS